MYILKILFYPISLGSMAKALTVRIFPMASSAIAIARDICSCASLDIFLRREPNPVPTWNVKQIKS